MSRSFLFVPAFAASLGCGAPSAAVLAPEASGASEVQARSTPSASTRAPRWGFPEGNVRHAAAMLRAAPLVEEAVSLAVEAYREGHEACPNGEPIPSTLPTATSIALADPTSFTRDPGWRCVRFKPTGKLEFQFTFRSAPPFKKVRRDVGDPMFQACAEAELVAGGRTTVVCWSVFRDPITEAPTIADRADIEIEPFEADDTPLPAAPPGATPAEVCRRLAAIHSPRLCEADLNWKRDKNPEDFACVAGCSTLEHADDRAYCVERCILAKIGGPGWSRATR